VISRVADHCFWLGRYVERAEATARVLTVTHNLALDRELPAEHCWTPVLIVAGEAPKFTEKYGVSACSDGEQVQQYMTFGEENWACIRKSVAAAGENARSIREVVSLEIWEALNECHLWLSGEAAEQEFRENRFGFYKRVRTSMSLVLGHLRGTMLHDPPLEFIFLGVALERAGQTARFLDVHHHAMDTLGDRHQVEETALWLSILRACSGFEPFMKRHRGIVTGEAVARFLIFEDAFPRSVAYSVTSAARRVSAIVEPLSDGLPGGPPLRMLESLDAWLDTRAQEDFDEARTHEILTHVVDRLAEIATGIGTELLGYEKS